MITQKVKKWVLAGTISFVGIMAMILGFVAAYGDSVEGKWTVDSMYVSLKDYADGALLGHMGMAYIGGLIVGCLGVTMTIVGLYLLWLAYTNALTTRKHVFYCALVFSVAVFILAIAAIACQGRINSQEWLGKNVDLHNSIVMDILNKAFLLK